MTGVFCDEDPRTRLMWAEGPATRVWWADGSATGGSWTGVRDGSTSDRAVLWSGESAEGGGEEGVAAFLPLLLPRPPLAAFFVLPRPLPAEEEAPAAVVCILSSSALRRGWAGIMEPPLPVALAGGLGRSSPLPTILTTHVVTKSKRNLYEIKKLDT